jgi:hypothetical protein
MGQPERLIHTPVGQLPGRRGAEEGGTSLYFPRSPARQQGSCLSGRRRRVLTPGFSAPPGSFTRLVTARATIVSAL